MEYRCLRSSDVVFIVVIRLFTATAWFIPILSRGSSCQLGWVRVHEVEIAMYG